MDRKKDNEIAGSGNIYTALYWQYDSCLGRRWNVDPRPISFVSDYACFRLNPILYSDVLGDTIEYASFRDKAKVFFGKIANENFRNNLEILEGSEETYVFRGNKSGMGMVSTDGDKIYINYAFKGHKTDFEGTKRNSTLYHEAEHGTQFEDGRIGFFHDGTGWQPFNNDFYDEFEGKEAGYEVGYRRKLYFNEESGEKTATTAYRWHKAEQDANKYGLNDQLTKEYIVNNSYPGYTKQQLVNATDVRVKNDQFYMRPYNGSYSPKHGEQVITTGPPAVQNNLDLPLKNHWK